MKKRIHCTCALFAIIMPCTSGMEVVHPLKQWICRRWAWMDRAAEKPEDPLPIAYFLSSTRCLSWNTGTEPFPHHHSTQRPPVLRCFPPICWCAHRLSYPFDIKNTIEHKKNCTGAQNLMFLYDLKENYCQSV